MDDGSPIGIRVLLIGTVVWAVALLGLLPFSGRLSEEGRTWWIWCCLAGVGMGLLGWEVARRRRG